MDPFDAHVAPTHVPPLQLWSQQALLVVQTALSAAQVGWAQTLLVQMLLQQSPPWTHAPPDGAQVAAVQAPSEQELVQQSLGPLHDSPTVPQPMLWTEASPAVGDLVGVEAVPGAPESIVPAGGT
jgi:hypothetical protein